MNVEDFEKRIDFLTLKIHLLLRVQGVRGAKRENMNAGDRIWKYENVIKSNKTKNAALGWTNS